MSRFGTYRGLGFPMTGPGGDAATTIREKTKIQQSGSRWTGSNRRGGRSLMDQAELSRQALDYAGKYKAPGSDDLGVYNLEVQNENGDAQANASINIGGRYFQSSSEGKLRIVDSEYLNSEIESWKEVQKYETSLVEAVVISPEVAKTILGKYTAGLAVGGLQKARRQGGAGLSADRVGTLDTVDAQPEVIRYLDPTSTEYARAIAKIKVLVNAVGIVLNEEGGNLRSADTAVKITKDSGMQEKA